MCLNARGLPPLVIFIVTIINSFIDEKRFYHLFKIGI
ncbi:hypothetical protein KEN51_CDS0051 [Pseudomonas phage vB_Pae10145-KEN51]|nr:hypothetical protein [Pseudomonas phage PhiPizzaParty]WRQ05906.1 hypothetical protein IPCDMZAV_CDS0383 [Pseudomonas phage 6B]WRQ05993.1 hypothetical protein QAMIJHJT_CDS0061 [Pseudomonas phage 9-Ps-8B]WRQ06401.1 hypothetical protein FOPPYZMZ_CDS0060 [Pseudomonas phage 9Ps-7B]WRQ06752.1 hypothetical protein ZBUARNPM_CDS0002 [Pseudomonas phage 14Ps5-6]